MVDLYDSNRACAFKSLSFGTIYRCFMPGSGNKPSIGMIARINDSDRVFIDITSNDLMMYEKHHLSGALFIPLKNTMVITENSQENHTGDAAPEPGNIVLTTNGPMLILRQPQGTTTFNLENGDLPGVADGPGIVYPGWSIVQIGREEAGGCVVYKKIERRFP